MRLQAFITLLVVGGSTFGHALHAAEPEPPPTEPAPEPEPATPRCATDPASASLAVKLAFTDLLTIHRARVPGPSGQRIVDTKVDQLLERTVDLGRFTADALSPMWSELDAERQRAWSDDLRVGLRGHYLKRLTSDGRPLEQRLDITQSDVACDRATVRVALASRQARRDPTDLVLRLRFTELGWRAVDVSVDGVSLLETWKNRFRQVYRDGGVAAIDEHLRQLAARHRSN